MAMTPEEYAAKEFNVPVWNEEEPLYAPGPNPSEQDPNILRVLNGGAPEPAPTPDPDILAMAHEYNFTLPLELRRAEVATELQKQANLAAQTAFWEMLTVFLASLVQ